MRVRVRRTTLPPEPEKHFHNEVVRMARMYGWRVYFTWKSVNSPEGWPDLVLVKPPRLLIWELKTESGKVTPAQSETLTLLGGCTDLSVRVVRPSMWPTVMEELRAA
jgi:hypothetical protein